MGREASFQAMPEDSELMIAARQDGTIAYHIANLRNYDNHFVVPYRDNPKWIEFCKLAQKVVNERPDLLERYFYAGGRTFDAIVYLLSPARRSLERDDKSLIHQAIYGEQQIHSKAYLGQGYPMNMVSAHKVKIIADYLDQITPSMMREHYQPDVMWETGVYKMHAYPLGSENAEWRFKAIWEEFVGMREVYRAAADHGEAMINMLD